MRFSKWMVIAVCAAVTTSCGENSTTETKTNADTSTTATTPRTDVSEPVNTSTSLNVPEPTRTAFTTKYPNAANVSWRRYEPVNTIDWDWTGWPKMDTSDYAVSYNADGSEHWAWYDQDNNWIGTVSSVTDFASLPAAVTKTVQAQYPGYTITSVDKENDKNRVAYEIELNKGNEKAKLLVAEDGKVIKKKVVS
ncbi:MAG TPA: PepSY-like domain-containing protein [Chitinophagaceae bacterium]